MSSGPLRAEVLALRQELAAVKRLVSGLEARIAVLEAEAEFETVSVSECLETGSGGGNLSSRYPLQGLRHLTRWDQVE